MKLSIITTIYQAEKDLSRLLDSMMAHKSPELEFFLIDNGCTDGSAAICKAYAEKDSRFKIHTLKKNIGYIRARNLGLKIVNADYVGFCDSDDFLCEGAYDSITELLKQHSPDLLLGGWNRVSNADIFINHPPIHPGFYAKQNIETILPQFFGELPGKPMIKGFMWKQCFNLSLIRKFNIEFKEDLKPYEDMLFNASFASRCNSIYVTDMIIYNYIVNEDSITAKIASHYNPTEEGKRVIMLHKDMSLLANSETCHKALATSLLKRVQTIISMTTRKYNPWEATKVLKQTGINATICEIVRNAIPNGMIDRLSINCQSKGLYLPLCILAYLRTKIK